MSAPLGGQDERLIILMQEACQGAGAILSTPPAEEAQSAVSKDEAEQGMAAMSEKFRAMGSQVYLDAEKVKESNRVL